MKVTATNRLTGEKYAYQADTRDEVLLALDEVEATRDAYSTLRKVLYERCGELLREEMEASKSKETWE